MSPSAFLASRTWYKYDSKCPYSPEHRAADTSHQVADQEPDRVFDIDSMSVLDYFLNLLFQSVEAYAMNE
jgi:hypothetical protein